MKSPLQQIKDLYGDNYIKVVKDKGFLKKGRHKSKVSNKKILKNIKKEKQNVI